jgi:hypothetical protein
MAKQIGLLQEQTGNSKATASGMDTAFTNARERILSVDVNRRIQLDAEELRLYAELKKVKDSELAPKGQVAKLKAEFEQEKSRADRLADHSRTVISKNETLHATKDDMEQKLKDLDDKHRSAEQDIARFKRQVRILKRKRTKDDGPPPPTKLLVRPQSLKAATASQPSASPTRSDSPSLLQPAAKKSRSRKANRWDNAPAIPSSDNVNEKEKIRQSQAAVAHFAATSDRPCFDSHFTADTVLLATLTSFRTKCGNSSLQYM